MKKKSVKAYANPGSDKCMVCILDLHTSKVPYSGFFSRAIYFVNFANDNHFAKINSSNFINFR